MKVSRRKDKWWVMETRHVMVGASNPIKLVWEYVTFMFNKPPALVKRAKSESNPTKGRGNADS